MIFCRHTESGDGKKEKPTLLSFYVINQSFLFFFFGFTEGIFHDENWKKTFNWNLNVFERLWICVEIIFEKLSKYQKIHDLSAWRSSLIFHPRQQHQKMGHEENIFFLFISHTHTHTHSIKTPPSYWTLTFFFFFFFLSRSPFFILFFTGCKSIKEINGKMCFSVVEWKCFYRRRRPNILKFVPLFVVVVGGGGGSKNHVFWRKEKKKLLPIKLSMKWTLKLILINWSQLAIN